MSYIFIIPGTPEKNSTPARDELWRLTYQSLIQQKYENWKAIFIGRKKNHFISDERFTVLKEEARKGEKIRIAVNYILENNIPGDRIIRLDDDDVINPNILESIKGFDFDLFTDKHQWFWHYESGYISYRIWSWIPNTVIHKREHAFTKWNDLNTNESNKYLIENEHSSWIKFYSGKKIVFTKKNNPIYIRTISNESITAQNAKDQEAYLKRFGLWHKNNLKDFQFLNEAALNKPETLPQYTLKEKLSNLWMNFRSSQNYQKNI